MSADTQVPAYGCWEILIGGTALKIQHWLLCFTLSVLFSCGELIPKSEDNGIDSQGNNEITQDDNITEPDAFPEGAKISAKDFKLSTFFTEKKTLSLLDDNLNMGLYFNELEIVAYMHRPNESLQSGCVCGGWGAKNWSHWVVLQSGHDDARDHVLKRGARLDISKLNGSYEEANRPSDEFMKNVREFRIDMFEVNMDGVGALYNDAFYGATGTGPSGTENPLFKYPEFQDLTRYASTPRFPSIDANRPGALNVFFVRKDWFPKPVTILISNQANEIDSSSIALTDEQKERILDMIDSGTSRRFYQNLVLIPFDGPIVVKFPELDEDGKFDPREGAQDPSKAVQTSTEEDATPGLAFKLEGDKPTDFSAFNINILISFDLSDMINTTTSEFTGDGSSVNFNLDENGLPFKLKVEFYEKFEIPSSVAPSEE